MFISAEDIERARQGDMKALAELDCRGLTPAVDEDANAFADRLQLLNANFAKMSKALSETGEYAVEEVSVDAASRIPKEIFTAPGKITEKLYGFKCDWVPGFFITPKFGLFGGCAYCFFPDFFALFIIRRSFQKRQKWLWYQRNELLAHELCHIARLGCGSEAFEEFFAYQTATTAFRRVLGGIFRSQFDVFLFLAVTLLQLVSQMARTFAFPQWPAWPAWTLLAGVTAFLLLRLRRDIGCYRRALAKLTHFYGSEATARMALFHSTDGELRELAKAESVSETLGKFAGESLRWRIVKYRTRK